MAANLPELYNNVGPVGDRQEKERCSVHRPNATQTRTYTKGKKGHLKQACTIGFPMEYTRTMFTILLTGLVHKQAGFLKKWTKNTRNKTSTLEKDNRHQRTRFHINGVCQTTRLLFAKSAICSKNRTLSAITLLLCCPKQGHFQKEKDCRSRK